MYDMSPDMRVWKRSCARRQRQLQRPVRPRRHARLGLVARGDLRGYGTSDDGEERGATELHQHGWRVTRRLLSDAKAAARGELTD
jgi:hypothetical protein